MLKSKCGMAQLADKTKLNRENLNKMLTERT
jgi:DNA-binding phage protein